MKTSKEKLTPEDKKAGTHMHCVECRWCSLTGKPGEAPGFQCQRDGKKLPNDVVSLKACRHFEPPHPAGHWGP